jgi:xylan 1,4-beta-xylosidase
VAISHDPSAPHVNRARVEIDAGATGTPLKPIWASIGYDEFNWTYTPTGTRLLGLFTPGFYVRPHYVFISGTGFGLPHWGSGNVYHQRADGTPFYDFAMVDAAYDAIVGAGHHLLVELGFTPRDLVPDEALANHTIIDSPTVYSAYEAGQWSYPPKDYAKWGDLVAALAQHSLERYGEQEVSTWLWELWNEPDIYYWRGTHAEFCELYAVTVEAVRRVIPNARVGGPTVTGGPDGADFLRRFLSFVEERTLPLDFVSFHTKGSAFEPWRTYGPLGSEAPEKQSPSTGKMLHEIRTLMRVMAEFPKFADLPAIVDECDAGVPAHRGVYDNSNFAFQNTEYYPVFQASLMKKILDLNDTEVVSVEQATSWSFYFEGERYFEGTRAFLTAGGVEKPLLNAYRMFAQLGSRRIPALSDSGWPIEALDEIVPNAPPEEVDALATRDEDGRVAVIVYRRTDDQYQSDAAVAEVSVVIGGLAASRYRVTDQRIDHYHSNSHTAWVGVGAPQDPTARQLAEITARQSLEFAAQERTVRAVHGSVELTVSLPLTSVSLLVLTPTPG